MNAFTDNLKQLRQSRGLKQEELAEALDTDIYELIYGARPGGAHPKFQRKFVTRCWVFGVTVILILLFWMFLMPVLKLLRNTSYDMRYLSMEYIVPVLGWFSAGALIPNGLALVYPVELEERWRKRCVILGTVLVLPGLLVGLNFLIVFNLPDAFHSFQPFIGLFYAFLIQASGWVFLLMMLPFLSGILIFLGQNKE